MESSLRRIESPTNAVNRDNRSFGQGDSLTMGSSRLSFTSSDSRESGTESCICINGRT